MIYGIGTDIVALPRMHKLFERYGQRLAEHILAACEMQDYCNSTESARFLAKRFAAKEAFAKALGTGLRAPVTLRAIALEHDGAGKPLFAPASAALRTYLEQQAICATHLSLSDEREYVLAFVVVEQQGA